MLKLLWGLRNILVGAALTAVVIAGVGSSLYGLGRLTCYAVLPCTPDQVSTYVAVGVLASGVCAIGLLVLHTVGDVVLHECGLKKSAPPEQKPPPDADDYETFL